MFSTSSWAKPPWFSIDFHSFHSPGFTRMFRCFPPPPFPRRAGPGRRRSLGQTTSRRTPRRRGRPSNRASVSYGEMWSVPGLVNVQKTMENHHSIDGTTMGKWWFIWKISMLLMGKSTNSMAIFKSNGWWTSQFDIINHDLCDMKYLIFRDEIYIYIYDNIANIW
jgi:hypothetical protein